MQDVVDPEGEEAARGGGHVKVGARPDDPPGVDPQRLPGKPRPASGEGNLLGDDQEDVPVAQGVEVEEADP